MTGQDLYNRLVAFGDIDIENATVIGWIDKAQKEIAIDFPVLSRTVVEDVEDGTTTEIATGIIDILSATYEEGTYPLEKLEVSGNTITFRLAADSVTLNYSTLYPDFISITQSLSVHPLFQPIVLDYLISLYYEAEAEGDPEESSMAREFYQRWMFHKNQIIATLSSSNINSQRDPVRTTDTLPKTTRRSALGSDFYE